MVRPEISTTASPAWSRFKASAKTAEKISLRFALSHVSARHPNKLGRRPKPLDEVHKIAVFAYQKSVLQPGRFEYLDVFGVSEPQVP